MSSFSSSTACFAFICFYLNKVIRYLFWDREAINKSNLEDEPKNVCFAGAFFETNKSLLIAQREAKSKTPVTDTAEHLTDTGAHPTQAALFPLWNFQEPEHWNT